MTVRTKVELAQQINSLLPDNMSEEISPADVRSVLIDMVDSLEAVHGGVVGMHLRYFGWSADRTIDTADFAGASSSMTNDGTLPAQSNNAYIWFGVPASVGYPTQVFIDGGSRNNIAHFERLAAMVDDADGESHIIGISYDLQIAALGGRAFGIGYG